MKEFKEKLNNHFGFYYSIEKSLAKVNTKYQELELLDTKEFGKTLLLGGITQVTEKGEFQYHELLVHSAMLSHENPENILVIGAGDGGVNKEVLKHSTVKKLVHVELDEDVIHFSKKYLPSVNGGSFQDPRLQIIIQDGFSYLENTQEKFDVIIMDMTDPMGPSIELYTQKFFSLVKETFKSKASIFSMHTESPVARPKLFNYINKTLKSIFPIVNPFYNYVQMYSLLWSVAISSIQVNTKNIPLKTIKERIKFRKLTELELITFETFFSMQVTFPYIQKILNQSGKIITNFKDLEGT